MGRESADVVLIGNDLDKFVENREDRAQLSPNSPSELLGTLIDDTVGIGLAAAGILNPLLATFIHVASELIFILTQHVCFPPARR